ncbi:probable cytochrome P450 6a14 [Bactrocera dorsalis]|uniref:Probable cytochrome P450 6a14 n=1 Tax=Bactrocera dorsalis TaxID=27457 RepID=A0A6I9V843_BACDO|nr:probable cytochrome P450 6a14 [Bactrocera dorsalis]
MFVFLALLVAAFGLIVIALHRHYTYWQRRGVPQVRPRYVVGNIERAAGGQVQLRHFNQRLYETFKKGRPFVGMYIFFTRAALILDLDVIKDICISKFSNFQDRGVFSNPRDDPLTGHLFRLEGAQWRAMRNKLTPVFSSGNMKFMFPTVVKVGNELVRACHQAIGDSRQQCELELKELCARYTTDVIGTCAFGIECNSLLDPQPEFRRRGHAVFTEPRHSQLVQTFMLMNPDWARRLRLKFFPDHIIQFYIDVVRQTVELRQREHIKRNDFMDLLIGLKAEDERLALNSDGIDLSQGLTLHQMVSQAFVFFVAGFDTSSTTMSLCLYELALNMTKQEQVRAEIVRVLKEYNNQLTYEALNEMQYLDQAVDETLRKYPVVPYLVRKAKADYLVPNTNEVIEKGCLVVLPAHAIQHDEELYPEPDKFNPNRFKPELCRERHAAAYMPFGIGPRACIGLRFGKMQAKIGLINLLKHFKFRRSANTQVPLQFIERIFQITPASGIYLSVEPVDGVEVAVIKKPECNLIQGTVHSTRRQSDNTSAELANTELKAIAWPH